MTPNNHRNKIIITVLLIMLLVSVCCMISIVSGLIFARNKTAEISFTSLNSSSSSSSNPIINSVEYNLYEDQFVKFEYPSTWKPSIYSVNSNSIGQISNDNRNGIDAVGAFLQAANGHNNPAVELRLFDSGNYSFSGTVNLIYKIDTNFVVEVPSNDNPNPTGVKSKISNFNVIDLSVPSSQKYSLISYMQDGIWVRKIAWDMGNYYSYQNFIDGRAMVSNFDSSMMELDKLQVVSKSRVPELYFRFGTTSETYSDRAIADIIQHFVDTLTFK